MPEFKNIVDEAIISRLSGAFLKEGQVASAMRYAAQNGGKRVRPQLLLRLLYDLKGEYTSGIPAAVAIEMIHTYSLIHDDLPAMDNDDYRRGKPTVHKEYGEDIAILAGDGLLTEAFLSLTEGDYPSEVTRKLVQQLAMAAGASGMVYGQELDLKAEKQPVTQDELKTIHQYKTGKLLSAPLCMAAIIAQAEKHVALLQELGETIGLAFQIQDDVFDATKQLKNPESKESSDAINHKTTYLSFMAYQEAEAEAKRLYEEVLHTLNRLPLLHHTTAELLCSLIERVY